MSHESIRTILKDYLGLKHDAARLVPKDLNFLQNLNHVKAKISTNIIEQQPYSPDMGPADFFLFPKLKLPLWGSRFQSIEDIKENSRRNLKKSIPENAFKKCFYIWIICWHKCIISKEAYFKGDEINLDELRCIDQFHSVSISLALSHSTFFARIRLEPTHNPRNAESRLL